jgi:hypothetical protein
VKNPPRGVLTPGSLYRRSGRVIIDAIAMLSETGLTVRLRSVGGLSGAASAGKSADFK